MKKIALSFLLIISVLGFLFVPIFMIAHANGMSMHHGSMESCMEHCLESIDGFTEKLSITKVSKEISVVFQVIFVQIYTFVLPLSLLYVYLFIPPPNSIRRIKNYNYSTLIGIIKLTT